RLSENPFKMEGWKGPVPFFNGPLRVRFSWQTMYVPYEENTRSNKNRAATGGRLRFEVQSNDGNYDRCASPGHNRSCAAADGRGHDSRSLALRHRFSSRGDLGREVDSQYCPGAARLDSDAACLLFESNAFVRPEVHPHESPHHDPARY